MIYAIWNTIFVNCYSLRNFKVPIELLEFGVNEEEVEYIGLPTENLKLVDSCPIMSPRNRSNGESFYLCSNNVAWIYAYQEHGRGLSEELEFLRKYGLIIGRDMVLVNVKSNVYSMGCDWLKIVDRGNGYLKVFVKEDKLYKGLSPIRIINK